VIEGEAVRLAPIAREVAVALLEGRRPDGIAFAQDYPSKFSLEVMDILAGARAATPDGDGFHPRFVVRIQDGVVVGEIGCSLSGSTAVLGYSIVESCQGRGYATDALRALIASLREDPRVERITAQTLAEHAASRRVMEKAGMRLCAQRLGEVDGVLAELAVYETT
jgi:RimJ/RimL family protein N-acetyltransferase